MSPSQQWWPSTPYFIIKTMITTPPLVVVSPPILTAWIIRPRLRATLRIYTLAQQHNLLPACCPAHDQCVHHSHVQSRVMYRHSNTRHDSLKPRGHHCSVPQAATQNITIKQEPAGDASPRILISWRMIKRRSRTERKRRKRRGRRKRRKREEEAKEKKSEGQKAKE